MNGASSKNGFAQSLTQFLEMGTFKRIPPCTKSFEYAYINWLSVMESANAKTFQALPIPAQDYAVPGSLPGQCLACFYRPDDQCSMENHSSQRSPPQVLTAVDTSLGTSSTGTTHLQQEQTPCFRPWDLKHLFYVAVDGNMQHRRFAQRSQNELVQEQRQTFINMSELRIPISSESKEGIRWGSIGTRQSRANSGQLDTCASDPAEGNGHNLLDRDTFRHMTEATLSDYPLLESNIFALPSKRYGCPHAFAADKGNSPTASKHEKPPTMHLYDETGCLGIVCRHGIPLRLGDLYRGENQESVLKVLKSVLLQLPEDANFFIQYDLACKFLPYLQRTEANSGLAARCRLSVNAFHTYSHDFKCQLEYGPLQILHLGRTDGEGVERNWSYCRHLIPILRISSAQHRHDILHAFNLHLAKLRQRDMPNHLARRLVRIHKERDEVKTKLATQARNWQEKNTGKSYDDFITSLRRKFEHNRGYFLNPERQVVEITRQAHPEYPLRHIFTELCRLQSSHNFLKPNGTWTDITERIIRQRHSGLIPFLESGIFKPEDWRKGSALWKHYFSEVAIVHLHHLKNELRTEHSSRLLEFRRVTWSFHGHKESTKIFRSINNRSGKIPGLVNDYNTFLLWVGEICPEKFPPSLVTDLTIEPDQYNVRLIEEVDGEPLWQNEGSFLGFWNKESYWAWDPQQLRCVNLLLKLDRSDEEIDLLTIEMGRLFDFVIRNFDIATDTSSPLRACRNWQEYINNFSMLATGCIKNAALFHLETRGIELRGMCPLLIMEDKN
jgi:hypothetical protein